MFIGESYQRMFTPEEWYVRRFVTFSRFINLREQMIHPVLYVASPE